MSRSWLGKRRGGGCKKRRRCRAACPPPTTNQCRAACPPPRQINGPIGPPRCRGHGWGNAAAADAKSGGDAGPRTHPPRQINAGPRAHPPRQINGPIGPLRCRGHGWGNAAAADAISGGDAGPRAHPPRQINGPIGPLRCRGHGWETPRRRMQKAAAMQGGVPTPATNRWSDRTTQMSRARSGRRMSGDGKRWLRKGGGDFFEPGGVGHGVGAEGFEGAVVLVVEQRAVHAKSGGGRRIDQVGGIIDAHLE
jgi:hypothetical protein